MRPLLQNKTGDVQSIIIMITVVFALAIGAIVFWKVFLDMSAEWKQNPSIKQHNKTVEVMETVEDKGQGLLDLFVFMTLIGLMIGVIISAIYLPSHPAVTGIFIIAMLIAIFLSGIFANVFEKITTTPELASTASQFSLTSLILGSHFPIILTFLFIIVVIVLYGKSKSSNEVPA